MDRRLANQRGIAVPFLAITMCSILGLAAVGIDVGLLATTASEVQNAADITALAGVRALAKGETPVDDAKKVLQLNDARATQLSASNLKSLTIGNYTDETGFVANLMPFNAVESEVVFQHNGILTAVTTRGKGSSTSNVTKSAVAALDGVGKLRPTLPVAIGDCHFDENCGDDNCMPFIQLHGSQYDNAAWTGYFEGHNASTVTGYLPTPCGEGNEVPEITADGTQFIDLVEGGETKVLQAIECMFNNGEVTHTIPIVTCADSGHFNKPAAVVGFATIVIESVTTTGPAAKKGITVSSIHATTVGGAGGGNFGTRVAKLVR